MSRTAASALSRRAMNAPVIGLSAGISVTSSQWPLTWRNRSSCTRVSGSNEEKSIAGAVAESVIRPWY